MQQFTLKGGLIGIERETLRVNSRGELAQTLHPEALGSSYTNSKITVDYGEALLELVTGAHQDIKLVYQELLELHQYCAQNIGDELMWSASMPCILPEENEIAIAKFGTSNSGKLKHLYRRGLALRYGSYMQMIAGIHFNYSPPEALFTELAAVKDRENNQQFRNECYMGMLRTIQKYSWLICYLFGASTATDKTFKPAAKNLASSASRTYSWRQACSLRMSDFGYQNKVDFVVSFDDVERYTRDLLEAVLTPAPAFQYLGLKNKNGEFQQISENILQIENEYYAAARPKALLQKGEHPSVALRKRGISYVELRLLDVNPYEICGISLQQMYFLESFMLWAFLNPSYKFSLQDINENNHNKLRTACCGFDAEMNLFSLGKEINIETWTQEILQDILVIAEQLGDEHKKALLNLQNQDNRLTKKVHADLENIDFVDWALQLSLEHKKRLSDNASGEKMLEIKRLCEQSWQKFLEIEENAKNQEDFAFYLQKFQQDLRNSL